MNRRQLLTCLFLVPLTGQTRPPPDEKRRCRWLRARLRHLDSRLRAGYSGTAGRRLRARRRLLAKEKFRACR